MQTQHTQTQNKRGILAVFANADAQAAQLVGEIKANFEKFRAAQQNQVEGLSDRLLAVEQSKIVMPGFAGNNRASFGANVASTFAKHRDALRSAGRCSFDVAASIIGQNVGATDAATTPDTPTLGQSIWLADHLPVVPADGAFTLNYLRVTGVTGSAGVQLAEGSAKAQTQPTLTRIAQNQITVAGWCEMSDQALNSEANLQRMIDTHLRREVMLALDAALVDGNSSTGAVSPFDGFEALATAYASTFSGLRDAIVQAAISLNIAGFGGSIVVLHPTDYASIILERDTQSRYQNTADPFPGMRVALSSSVATGTALVADGQFLALHVAGNMRVQLALSDDNFKKNMVTARGEIDVMPALYDTRALLSVVPSGGSPA